MKTTIYWFSGSGNSLAVARELAAKLGADLVPIASVMDREEIEFGSDAVGFVFPVYYAINAGGLPLIVGRFVGKLRNIGDKYLFAVCTSGFLPGRTLINLDGLLRARGGFLSSGTALIISHAPYSAGEKLRSYFMKSAPRRRSEAALDAMRAKTFALVSGKLEEAAALVRSGRRGRIDRPGAAGTFLQFLLRLLEKPVFMARYRSLSGEGSNTSVRSFDELIPLADRSFAVGSACNGCGVCVRVCPSGNITLADGRPVWQHRCETCLACFVWCPQGAIGGEIVAYNERYHHPLVALADMTR